VCRAWFVTKSRSERKSPVSCKVNHFYFLRREMNHRIDYGEWSTKCYYQLHVVFSYDSSDSLIETTSTNKMSGRGNCVVFRNYISYASMHFFLYIFGGGKYRTSSEMNPMKEKPSSKYSVLL
jgi:hypothetical protein